ncbi:hypothetical protein F8568_028000 [Actinomadura sp. LD22]|uniref:Uncharacterized protein n=1 Tax=Actinomadura physcomitrii TaxID=2650748 RepID=A0A6I4MJ06_9ACTN|nr:hypothetical protein [Actinomadura physcomitrii]MWA04154.1 hypothetical protein [Actinomadura physcomitrii]
MGVRTRLLRFAAGRPPVFVAAAPGGTRTRLLVESELRRRNGRTAASPAAASVLVVCGRPGAALAEAVDAVWDAMPGPRALVRLDEAASRAEVDAGIDRAVRELSDVAAQQADAAERRERGPWSPSGMDGHTAQSGGHADHSGHEHHTGLAMAGRADDRDGLKLDVLHVPLGPVLKDWPAGLVLGLTLQGDVVQAVEVDVAEGAAGGVPYWDEPWLRAAAGERVTVGEAERRRAAGHLDSAGRLLAVAGWEGAAEEARLLRDLALAGEAPAELPARFARFARRVKGSRTLRWMLGGIGRIDQGFAGRHGLTGPPARHPGDVLARLHGWLDGTGEALVRTGDPAPLRGTDGPRGPVGAMPSRAVLALLPELLGGAELAAARLTVASLDPDVEQLTETAWTAHE